MQQVTKKKINVRQKILNSRYDLKTEGEVYGGIFRSSRADNSVVGDPIGLNSKFKMHVLTYKFKMDRINSNRAGVTSIF